MRRELHIENPKNYVGKIGETAEFTVKATGEGLTYKWEYSNANSSKWYASSMEGSKTDTVKSTGTEIQRRTEIPLYRNR